jgi:hypothetical protein
VAATKTGFVFVLHRDTGEPMFPVEERPVPASDVPGEQASPTQPFPALPPPLVPQTLRPEDAYGLFAWDREKCREQLEALRNEGIFTPPSLRGTVMYPGNAGWRELGRRRDRPRPRVAFFNATNLAFEVRLIRARTTSARRRRPRPPRLDEYAPMSHALRHAAPAAFSADRALHSAALGFHGRVLARQRRDPLEGPFGATRPHPVTLFEQACRLSGVLVTAGGRPQQPHRRRLPARTTPRRARGSREQAGGERRESDIRPQRASSTS